MALVALAFSLTTANAQTTLVSAGSTWHYHKGTNAPQTDWKSAADADLNLEWATGLGGFGYGDGDDATGFLFRLRLRFLQDPASEVIGVL